MPRMSKAASIKPWTIKRHVVSEVGDGKNLTDTDFQQVQAALDQGKAGGGSAINAQEITAMLQQLSTHGTINRRLDLDRAQEPKVQPKPYSGLDFIYDREFIYDDSGQWTGVLLRQFFGLSEGHLVSKEALRKLWKDDFTAAESLSPSVFEPSNATGEPVEVKRKATAEQAKTLRQKKIAKKAARSARAAQLVLDAAKAECERMQRRWAKGLRVYTCKYAGEGCRQRPFLTHEACARHERGEGSMGCKFRPKKVAEAEVCDDGSMTRLDSARAKAVVKTAPRVGLAARRIHTHLAVGTVNGCRRVKLTLTGATSAVCVRLRTVRPQKPPKAYGPGHFRPHRLTQEQRTQVRMETAHLQPVAALVRPCVTDDAVRIELKLSVHALLRPPPPCLERGWAIRPPVEHKRFSVEQVSFLRQLYEDPQRPRDHEAERLFKQKFADADGLYARSLRLSKAQCMAWFSSEKRRRAVAAAKAALEAVDDEDAAECSVAAANGTAAGREAGGAVPEGAAAVPGRGGAAAVRGRGGGRGRGCGRGHGRSGDVAAGVEVAPRVNVKEMRAEMRRLGYSDAEAEAPKGTAEVRAALEAARANPRVAAVADEGDTEELEDGGEGDSGEEDGEEMLAGEDVYAVKDIVSKRRRGGVDEYLIRWKGAWQEGLPCSAHHGCPTLPCTALPGAAPRCLCSVLPM